MSVSSVTASAETLKLWEDEEGGTEVTDDALKGTLAKNGTLEYFEEFSLTIDQDGYLHFDGNTCEIINDGKTLSLTEVNHNVEEATRFENYEVKKGYVIEILDGSAFFTTDIIRPMETPDAETEATQ